ncbi:hypothetical protein Tco_1579211 [Tanacetum coccineum]
MIVPLHFRFSSVAEVWEAEKLPREAGEAAEMEEAKGSVKKPRISGSRKLRMNMARRRSGLSGTIKARCFISVRTLGGRVTWTLSETLKMLKTGKRARSSAGKDPDHLLSSEINR